MINSWEWNKYWEGETGNRTSTLYASSITELTYILRVTQGRRCRSGRIFFLDEVST